MTEFINHPRPLGLIKLAGKMSNYQVSRQEASFIFTDGDKNTLGVIAIAASLAGMGGQAISVASNATSTAEEADYVKFNLGDKALQGWLWRSPFREGDEVEVAAEWQSDHYEVFSVARPSDKTIALYPHCSRAKARHIKNALTWWLITIITFQLSLSIFFLTIGSDAFLDLWNYMLYEAIWMPAGLMIFLGIAITSMARQWMPFVRVADKVFVTLGLPNPQDIDLVKSSKKQRSSLDTPEFGSMYFRY
jgi:hypothetical protein